MEATVELHVQLVLSAGFKRRLIGGAAAEEIRRKFVAPG